MTTPDLLVGVRLTPDGDQLGSWLASAASFDAAAADSIWLDVTPDSELDPLVLAAALAVTTWRARLILPAYDASAYPRHALRTLRRLSQDRLAILVPDAEAAEALEDDVPTLIRTDEFAGVEAVPLTPTDDPVDHPRGDGQTVVTDDVDAGGRDAVQTRRWLSTPAPEDRQSWSEICEEAVGRGAAGIVVDDAPVLLDLLRNPHPVEDRRDTHIAQG